MTIIPLCLQGKKYLRISDEARPASRKSSPNPRSAWYQPGNGSNGWFIVIATTRGQILGPFVYCGKCDEFRGLDEEPHTSQGHDCWIAGKPCIHPSNSVFQVNANIQAGILGIRNAIDAAVERAAADAPPPAVVDPPLLPAVVDIDFNNPGVPHADPADGLSDDEVGNEILDIMNPSPPQQIRPSGRPARKCAKPEALTYDHEETKKKASKGKKKDVKRTRVAKRTRSSSPISVNDSVRTGIQDTMVEEECEEEDVDDDGDSLYKYHDSPSDDDGFLADMSADVSRDVL